MDLNINDWYCDYAEFCDINDITPGEQITTSKLNYYTKSLYKDVAAVYGW